MADESLHILHPAPSVTLAQHKLLVRDGENRDRNVGKLMDTELE